MFCTMVMPASAASIGWTAPDGTYNIARVTKTSDWYYVYKPIDDATIARHTYGTESLITWPVGNTATYDVTIGVVGYGIKIEQALAAEGLTDKITGAAVPNDKGYFVIDVGVPSGSYSYGYEITVYDISWSVLLDVPQYGAGLYAIPVGDQSGTTDAVPASITAAKLIPIP